MRMFRRSAALMLIALLSLCGAGEVRAQAAAPPAPREVKVGVFVDPPFVAPKGEGFTGIAMELWQSIAGKLELASTYRTFPNIAALLQATASGEIDVAVTGLSITQDRLKLMDFTQPWYDSGLRIMIEQDRSQGLWNIVQGLQKSGHLRIYMWIAVIILFATAVLTLLDRTIDEEFPKEWHKGLAESFYHVMSVATSGKAPHKQVFGIYGRVLAALWMACGITIVAYVTSSITSVMTTSALNSQINSFADLPGKTIGVLKGGVAEGYAREQGLDVVSYDDIPLAVQGLLGRQVDAVVSDAPVLEYYDQSHPELPITEVGGIIRPEKYGFALPRNSALTRELSLNILEARESGAIDKIRARYLGNN